MKCYIQERLLRRRVSLISGWEPQLLVGRYRGRVTGRIRTCVCVSVSVYVYMYVCVNVIFIHEIKTVIHFKRNKFKIIFTYIKLRSQNNVVTEISQLLSNMIYIHQHPEFSPGIHGRSQAAYKYLYLPFHFYLPYIQLYTCVITLKQTCTHAERQTKVK